jgi:CheY-like chemotaxis protein
MPAQPQIIDHIIESSRALQGVLRAEPQRVATETLVEESAGLARRALGSAAPIQIRNEAHLYALEVDAARLTRAIATLIVHAVKHRAAAAPPVVVVAHATKAGADIRITQAGAGVAPRALTQTAPQGDAGVPMLDLQMALARQVVESQGGYLELRSGAPGAAPSLVVRLPARCVAREAGRAAPRMRTERTGLAQRLDGIHVLLVEDDPDALELLTLILRQTGADVTSFSLAAPAYEFFTRAEHQPDIVVSDIAMPAEDGCSFLWRLRLWESSQSRIPVPAVAVSALGRDEDVQRARAHGFDAHLQKPVDASRLIDLIAAWTRAAP